MKAKITILLLLITFLVKAQEITVVGTVKDDSDPLPGVSVVVKGTTKGTDTDFDGNYSIKVKKGDVLVFSYLGYKTVKRKVRSSKRIDVKMEEGGEVLDEIVVTSYGRAINSARSSASLSRAKKRSRGRVATNTVQQVLQGNATGVNVNTGSGQPGQAGTLIIRGVSSLSGNIEPLFVVDGIPVSPDQFRKLDQKKIKDISVLKNAAATSLYGNRGAGGVIVIRTKGRKNSKFNLKSKYEESYKEINENQFLNTQSSPLSTFSIDVDKASYSNIRRMINNGQKINPHAVKIEEMINYFSYDYPQPTDEHPFSINTEVVQTPWNKNTRLVRIGLQGKKYNQDKLPASNLTFLIDVSGSMNSPNKLGLLKSSFKLLVNQLRKKDKVSIVVYAGAAGVVLNPTSGNKKEKIMNAINRLNAGGSTAGGAGIKLAYKLAERNFMKNGNNRVILATDGDFNVGASSDEEMKKLIELKRKSGVFLSVLGFGYGNYKDSKLETLADKGNGNHAYIDNIQEANKVFGKEFGGTLYTIAKDVKIQIEFNPQNVAAYRLIGYENRLLENKDFTDDTIDAGELGSGHTVTALYEVLLKGQESELIEKQIKLKYSSNQPLDKFKDELFTVKFRYKKPDENKSKEIIHVAKNVLNEATNDMKFISAVAMFGMQIRKSKFHNNSKTKDVIALAKKGKGIDEDGYRSEFIRLVKSHK